jgi:hypothetical protein
VGLLAGTGFQASGEQLAAGPAPGGSAAGGDRSDDAARAARKGKRPGCRKFCQQAGGFGGGCGEGVVVDPSQICPPVEMPEQTVGGTRDGVVSIRATCMLDQDCVGAIILTSFKGQFGDPDTPGEYGRADLEIPAGATKNVKVGISKKGLEYLKKHGPDKTAFATVPLADKKQPLSISDDIKLLKP